LHDEVCLKTCIPWEETLSWQDSYASSMTYSGRSRILLRGGVVLSKDIKAPKAFTGETPLLKFFENFRWKRYILLHFHEFWTNFNQ